MDIRPLVFTLGNTSNYERFFQEQTRPQKRGKRLFDEGGSVWNRYSDALAAARLVGFSVYAVAADWNTDALPLEGKLYRELRWDSDLFKLSELTYEELVNYQVNDSVIEDERKKISGDLLNRVSRSVWQKDIL